MRFPIRTLAKLTKLAKLAKLATLATLATAAAPLPAQVAKTGGGTKLSFDASRPPRGTVVDTAGKPIRGATVSFRAKSLSPWRDTVLRTRPLPRVRTSRDGEFFVPLTHLHRLFTAMTAGQLSLVVEKEGYHPWIEALNGLRGYFGSKVVLRPITAADRFTIEVRNPKPGMKVRVRRFGLSSFAANEEDRWYDVPESGVLEAAMSFVPSPLGFHQSSSFTVPIGIDVQLVFPGRTMAPKPLAFGQKRVVVGDKVPQSRFVGVLRRADKKPLVSPRGLYHCPDGISRWFPVDPENVVENATLPLFALDAKDCLAANVRYIDPSEETIQLEPVPAPENRVLELRDGTGALVESAQAYFFDLEHLPAHHNGPQLGAARARRRLQVEKGRIDLARSALPGPGFLWIHAKGFEPHIQFDPRAITGTTRVDLGHRKTCGKLKLRVEDPEGRPIRGVHVVLSGTSTQYGALLDGLPQTDAEGRVTIENLASGNHTIQLVGHGVSGSTSSVHVRGTAVVNLARTLYRVNPYHILLVGDDDEPVPFRSVRTYATANRVVGRGRPSLRTNTTLTSDSQGRILFLDLPEGMQPRVSDMLGVLVRKAMNPLEDGPKVNRVSISDLDTILMPLPAAPVVRESLVSATRTSNRTLTTRAGCGVLLVRFPKGQSDATLSVYLRGAPPLRVTNEVIVAARKEQGAGLLVLDQRNENRRVNLAITGLAPADAADLRVELPGMNFVRNQPYLYGNSGLTAKPEGDGVWSVGLRDNGAYLARVLHPKFLLQSVEIPDGAVAKPIPVKLARGTEVVFRLKSSVALQPSFQFNLYVHSQTNQMVLYQREKLSESNLKKIEKDRWELRLPFALPPGKYFFSVRVYNTQVNLSRRLFTVPDGGPFYVDVDRRNARVPRVPRGLATDAAKIKTQIDQLKKQIDALKKVDTDAKSKARLQKVLDGIEAKLAAQEAELKRVLVEEAKKKAEENAKEKAKEALQKARQRKLEAARQQLRKKQMTPNHPNWQKGK